MLYKRFETGMEIEEDSVEENAMKEGVDQDCSAGASGKHAVRHYGAYEVAFVGAKQHEDGDSSAEWEERRPNCLGVDRSTPGDS